MATAPRGYGAVVPAAPDHPRTGGRGTATDGADSCAPTGATTAPLVAPGLRVLFCGINPSLRSARTGHHFAHPANRFWTTLHRSGFTDRLLRPSEQAELLDLGLGVTNIADRATARASELPADELRAGAARLTAELEALRPAWLAVLGVTAYRTAFAEPGAQVGEQERRVGPARVWLLPNPSGLNAHWTPTTLAEAFSRLRAGMTADPSG